MKGLPMPISSPSRPDNFPPPLMRFSRSNTPSRSRGRSRSSPMLYLRSKRNAAAGETAQEPSSPKVTCFGQVRVAKSKAKTTSANGRRRRRRRCWLLRKTTGNVSLGFRRQTGTLRRIFFSCVFFSKSMEDSNRSNPDPKNNQSPPNPRPEAREATKTFLDDSITVPKNALILTRCRSAPYRSSSLGGRIWGSPFPEPEPAKSDESQTASSDIESNIRGSDRNKEELGNSTSNCVKESKGIGGAVSTHPLLLTRCKSGPARTGEGERVNTQSSFWKPRVCTVDICSLDNSES